MEVGRLDEFTYYRGRVALGAILRALGLSAGDAVALQAFTCVAVPEAILSSGLRPMFVDIERYGLNMDPAALEKKLSGRPRVVVVQHTFGIPARMDEISRICKDNDIILIEDCCHTYRSRFGGKTVGEFGSASFYSFEWGKPIVAGIGGSAVSNEHGLADRLRTDYVNFRNPRILRELRIAFQYYGFLMAFRPSLYWAAKRVFRVMAEVRLAEGNYTSSFEGGSSREFLSRMSRVALRRLRRNLRDLDNVEMTSRKFSEIYRRGIDADGIRHVEIPEAGDPVFARYPMLADDKERLLARAREEGVEIASWYETPIHPLSEFELEKIGYEIGECPEAENRALEIVSLPVHRKVRDGDARKAVDFLCHLGNSKTL